MKGRVGDSPIIGSGLFMDNQVGAATATGLGEAVIKTVGSFLIVELMRNGWSPQKACKEAIGRILSQQTGKPDFQVGFIAINIAGERGAFAFIKVFHLPTTNLAKPSMFLHQVLIDLKDGLCIPFHQ